MTGGRRCRGDHEQKGSLAIELVVLTPVIVLFALVALALGRFELAREEVVSAARAAAEAASVVSSPSEAQQAAFAAASPVVASQVHSCAQLNVVADTGNFVPGGFVRVVVSCQISFTDLLVPGMPGHATVSASVSAPIDSFRSVQ
jgi:Flp pilus assembly protein TadG